MAVMQSVYAAGHGNSFVNGHDDIRHFVLNLLFVSDWGFAEGFSFNGPAWSVSVEIFLYITFFAFARWVGGRPLAILTASAGAVLFLPFSPLLAGGVMQFYAGGLAYAAYRMCRDRFPVRAIAVAILAAALVLLVYIWERETLFGLEFLRRTVPSIPKLDIRYQIVRDMVFPTLCFPPLILALALAERARPLGRRLAWLGDISYSVYLIHFPLQLLFVLITDGAGWPRTVYYSPLILVLYMTVLIGLSLLSYHYFERPVMRLFRRRQRPPRPEQQQDRTPA